MAKKTNYIILAVTVVLAAATAAMIYWTYDIIAKPVQFESDKAQREEAVINRLKDIREAERQFKKHHGRFTASFDTLIDFVLHGQMTGERRIVDEDDSVMMANYKQKFGKKWKNIETFTYLVKDSIFKHLDTTEIKNLRYIPYTNNRTEFILRAGNLATESKVVIPTVECLAPYKAFLDTIAHRQEVINLIDNCKTNLNRYPGLKFGSMEGGNNEAGNWE